MHGTQGVISARTRLVGRQSQLLWRKHHVLLHRETEERLVGVLQQQAHAPAGLRCVGPYAVDQHGPVPWRAQAGQQGQRRAASGAGGSTEREHTPGHQV